MTTPEACLVDGCSSGAHGFGFCQSHYMRLRRHGDPLAGRTSSSALKEFLDQAIHHDEKIGCLLWPYAKDQDGYAKIALGGNPRGVHRIVCKATHGEPPTPRHQAAHSCGNGHKGCVNPHHVFWKTPTENLADQLTHGTRTRGSKQHSSKLSEADVISIRAMKGQLSQRRIAKLFGVNQAAISAIHRGKNWAWLT